MKTLLACVLAACALSGCSATDETSGGSSTLAGARRVDFRLTPTETGGLAKCAYLNAVSVSTGRPVKRDATGKVMDDVIACNWIPDIPDHPACPWGDLSKVKVDFIEPTPAP